MMANGEDELPTYFVDWSYLPDEVVLDRELQEFLERAILQLPPALRLTFIWRELEGLSTAETAEALEISEGAVKVRLHRARLKLRELLSGYFVELGADESEVDGSNGVRDLWLNKTVVRCCSTFPTMSTATSIRRSARRLKRTSTAAPTAGRWSKRSKERLPSTMPCPRIHSRPTPPTVSALHWG